MITITKKQIPDPEPDGKNGTEPLEPPEVMAAHSRTDIVTTPEGQQHDIDLMNDDSKWEQMEQEKPPEE